MHSHLKWIVAAWLGVAVTAWADGTLSATAETLTLRDAVRAALENNPGLLAARQSIEAAAGRALQSRLWPNPDLELSAEDMPTGAGLAQAKELIGVSQTLPFPGKKGLDARIGGAAVTTAEWEFRGRALELARDVKTAFYQTLAAGRAVEISRQLVELTGTLATAARQRVEAGASPSQVLLRAEIEHERATTELTNARRDLAVARQSLVTLMGQPERKNALLSGRLDESIDVAWLEPARQRWLQQHPDLKAAVAARERAELELKRARLEPLPDVTVGIEGGRNRATDESLVQVHLTVPLPLFDRSQGKQREARANAAIARHDRTAAEQRLLREFDEAEAGFLAAAEQVAIYRDRILPKSVEALEQVKTGFEQGKFSINDLLDTQRTVAEARLAYQRKLLELNTARAALESLMQKSVEMPAADTSPKKPMRRDP